MTEILDFSIRADRDGNKTILTMYHNARNVTHQVTVGRVDAMKIPDILCELLRGYQGKYEREVANNPLLRLVNGRQ